LNSRSSCLNHLSAGITGVSCHPWLKPQVNVLVLPVSL
jgi:hypothetical protein